MPVPPWWDAAAAFAERHSTALTALTVFSGVAFFGGLAALPWLAARIPADYFVGRRRPQPVSRRTGRPRSAAAVVSLFFLKNLLGATLVLAGIAMLVLPGQGVLTILAGLMLTDLPGKRRLERAIVGRPLVLRALNALRRRRGVEPLRVK
ncbi:MAG: PGPGW domain-containing protein [Planctomycetota bacterium]